MKIASLTLITALLVLFQSIDSRATGICQMEYRYSFDGVALDGVHRQTFVICEGACAPVPYLVPALRLPALSVRVSQDVATGKEGTQRGPEGRSRGIAEKKDTDAVRHSPDARITILFDLNSSTLSDAERAKLSSFAESTGAETNSGLSVTGYTCDLGGKAHNDILAGKRAEAVAIYLRKAGIRPSRITGMGKCCYATMDPDKRSLNRRVEVRNGKGEATQ